MEVAVGWTLEALVAPHGGDVGAMAVSEAAHGPAYSTGNGA